MTDNVDIYAEPSKKTTDFIIGFFLNIVIGGLHFSLYWLAYVIVNFFNSSRAITTILLIVIICSVEWIVIRHFFKSRRYIAIGMLASLLLPLLVTGFCSIVFNQAI